MPDPETKPIGLFTPRIVDEVGDDVLQELGRNAQEVTRVESTEGGLAPRPPGGEAQP